MSGMIRRSHLAVIGLCALLLMGCTGTSAWKPDKPLAPGESVVISMSTITNAARAPSKPDIAYISLRDEHGNHFVTLNERRLVRAINVVPSGIYAVTAIEGRAGQLSIKAENNGRNKSGGFELGFVYIPPGSVVYLGDIDVVYSEQKFKDSWGLSGVKYPFKIRIRDNSAQAEADLRERGPALADRMIFLPISFRPDLVEPVS